MRRPLGMPIVIVIVILIVIENLWRLIPQRWAPPAPFFCVFCAFCGFLFAVLCVLLDLRSIAKHGCERQFLKTSKTDL